MTWNVNKYARNAIEKYEKGMFHRELKELGVGMAGKVILDLGSGPGIWSFAFRELGAKKIVLQDNLDDCLSIAKTYLKDIPGIEYDLHCMEEIHYPDCYFDFVFCRASIMYSDDRRVFKEVHRVLKPGGFFYVMANDFRSLLSRSWSDWRKIPGLAAPFINFVAGRRVVPAMHHVSFLLKMRARDAGFMVRKEFRYHPQKRKRFVSCRFLLEKRA